MDAPYDPQAFPPFAVTVDVVILTVRPPQLEILLVQRSEAPFVGHWALPGGFVGVEQSLVDTAQAKLVAKTGLSVDHSHLEQLATFGTPGRDPRMRVVSVAYLALVPRLDVVEESTGREVSAWKTVADLHDLDLAFDHRAIAVAGIERARAKLEYTTLATSFCGPTFTMGELREVYETVWGHTLDPANFHRKVLTTEGFVEPTGKQRALGKGRPAKLYRRGDAGFLNPPLQR